MQLVVIITCASLLLLGAFVVFRLAVRRDYQKRGRLRPLTGLLELVVWGCFIGFPFLYNPPEWSWSHDPGIRPAQMIVGWLTIIVGAVVAFPAMAWLGFGRSLGQEADGLQRGGFYRLTRNPQIVGGILLVLGSALLWPSWYSLVWVGLYSVIGHLMVLTEEEHLLKLYGEDYARYCQNTPRYLGFPKLGKRQ